MLQSKRSSISILMVIMISLIFANSASATEILFNGSMEEGDGYQINNYVIEITEVFVEADSAVFNVYEKNELKHDEMLAEDDSYEFTIEGEDIELTLISVSSGLIPRANIAITISDDDIIYTEGVIDGGHEKATFVGTPELEITKSVSPQKANIGDIVTVTIEVENTGDDTATDVRFADPKPAGFILNEIILEETGPMSLSKYETRKVFLYKLEALQAGSFLLKPTTATYSNSAGQSFPQVSSSQPVITVEGGTGKAAKEANIDFSVSVDPSTIKRNGGAEVTIKMKNIGDAPAIGALLTMNLPDGLEFDSSNDNIEMIGGVPKLYFDTFGLQQEKEITYTIKASDTGTYTITTDYTYEYDNEVDKNNQEVSGDFTTGNINVVRGDYDDLLEQPLYVYLIPVIIIGAVGIWIYHRQRQYRF